MADTMQLTDEQLDFLKEMMNIGGGNAVTALSQMLGAGTEVKTSAVYSLPPKKVPASLGDPTLPVACVKMDLVGDVRGNIFFIVSDKEKVELVHMAEKALLGHIRPGPLDTSALEEIGNVMAGVYLTAIHDFCKLNIYHTVPALAIDMMQSLLDEALASMGRQAENIIVIEHEFVILAEGEIVTGGKRIRSFVLLLPSLESVKTLVDSVKNAMPQ